MMERKVLWVTSQVEFKVKRCRNPQQIYRVTGRSNPYFFFYVSRHTMERCEQATRTQQRAFKSGYV